MGVLFAHAEHVKDSIKTPQYLFTLSAKSGTLDGDKLTLKGVPLVVYFSDRPIRIAGHVSVTKFVVSWNKESDSFKADPPNATLSILGKVDETNVMVELTSVEQKRGSVVFKVAVLEGKVIEPFKEASLFIDQNTNIETSGVL